MSKGEQTRASILNDAMALASQVGLEGLSIGSLAARLDMSKSGLFAHFGAKEDLQRAVLERYREHFIACAFTPALAAPRGLPRLRALMHNWLHFLVDARLPGGCLFMAAAHEYDDRPGPLRDYIVATLRDVRNMVARAVRMAVEQGHLRADTDHWQLAFEIYGLMLAAHQEYKLFGNEQYDARALVAFERLVADHAAAAAPVQ
jgi:AcrR family transcriptional regulator